MCVALAREGIGKSMLMLQVAINAAWSGRGVLYVTMADLNQERLRHRVVRMRCGYTTRASAETKGAGMEYLRAETDLDQISFTIDDRTKRGSGDVDDILDTIETLRQRRLGTERPLTEAFIDYAQKLRSRKFTARDSYGESVYCSSQISNYAERSGLVIWVGSQLTPGNDKHGSQDGTKMGKHWQEDSGLTIKVVAKEGWARSMELVKSRFGGQFEKAEMVFNDEHLLFLPPGVHRPWL